ncbi:protein tyrosine phosphatase family protein [Usitatibacter palustris]|uniref:Phosphatase n=1 Tax=Usitatibacter palustris TaxID=2732487 RepID=A0A6M4H5T2_9PROT|nr:protein tyrosine phosphatase family protein [Usitatibacter palustris]QJR14535.1 hypothetical protein DSM104440_01336 [Usitatibacter palustris]
MNALRLGAAIVAFAVSAASAQGQDERPVNFVEITPSLATSGQPTAAMLEKLGAQGYQAVIYLAPPTVSDAVKDEPLILGKQGIVYLNIPVKFGAPQPSDFEAFTQALSAFKGRKVLVHCQVNLRASSFMFLHRVVTLRDSPETAWESVRRVWEPEPVWRAFILATLKRHNIAFEPL